MRRVAAASTCLLLLLLLASALAATATEGGSYLDRFTSIGWGGSDGSLPWSGPWQELGDDGDPKLGNVRVVSNGNCADGACMQLGGDLILLQSFGATRQADTTEFADEFELSFDLKTTGGSAGATLRVQISRNGSEWSTLTSYDLKSAVTEKATFEVDEDYRSEQFRIAFVYEGLLDLNSPKAHIDNVELLGVLGEEDGDSTTTTTTTTTLASTTTTAPSTTTTLASTTTTTRSAVTSTTSTTTTTTVVPAASGGDETPRINTTSSTTTTTPESGDDNGSEAVILAGSAPTGGGGIRQAARGVQADFDGALFGEVRTVDPAFTGVDVGVDFSMAVEVIESSWAWLVLLGLLIAWSAVSGLDRRQRRALHAEIRARS